MQRKLEGFQSIWYEMFPTVGLVSRLRKRGNY